MNKKHIAQLSNGENLQRGKSTETHRQPAQPGRCGFPQAVGYHTRQEGADAAQNQPVEKNQGNDHFITLELGQKFTDGQQLGNDRRDTRGDDHLKY